MDTSLLVLTDFTQPAHQALEYAAQLAEPLGGRIVLLHVQRDAFFDPGRFTRSTPALTPEALNEAFQTLARSLSVPVVAEVGRGRVAVAVAEAAGRHRPALVILGREEAYDIPDELISTTCLDLLRQLPYPMLVVPHRTPTFPLPQRVVLCADAEPFALAATTTNTVARLLRRLPAPLTVRHIVPVAMPPSSAQAAPLDATAATVALVHRAGFSPDQPITERVVSDDVVEGILTVAPGFETDLLVVIARPRSFWGELFAASVTAQIIRRSRLPLLVLPAQTE